MSNNLGRFCWYELMTTDVDAAVDYYGKVVGWTTVDGPTATSAPGEMPYRLLQAGQTGTGGIMALRPEAIAAGARPAWLGYVAVDDVDAYSDRVTEAGGAVHMSPTDIPGVGRFSVIADPHGAMLVLFRPGMEGQPLPANPTQSGLFSWRELSGGDLDRDFAFYSSLFGWKRGDTVPMGDAGIYQLFTEADGGPAIGGMMTRLPTAPVPMWSYYVLVDSASAAADRVRAHGGTVLSGPHPVPGGLWVLQTLDPQGAMIGMNSPNP